MRVEAKTVQIVIIRVTYVAIGLVVFFSHNEFNYWEESLFYILLWMGYANTFINK